MSNVNLRLQWVVALGLLASFSAADAPCQTLQIAAPADGAVVHSGETLAVTVTADPFEFRRITVYTRKQAGRPVTLTAPPYRFSIPIPAGISSGTCPVDVMGVVRSGGDPAYATVDIDVERADMPEQLTSEVPTMSFEYAGQGGALLEMSGVFSDGSRVILTESTYISYSSDTPGVATVDPTGVVTSLAPGRAKIIVTYGNPSIGTTSLKVPVFVPPPVTVLPSTSSLYPSQMEKLAASLAIDPDLDQSLVWSISPQLGDIDQTGLYTAPPFVGSKQRVMVTATSVADSAKSGSAEIWILPRSKNK